MTRFTRLHFQKSKYCCDLYIPVILSSSGSNFLINLNINKHHTYCDKSIYLLETELKQINTGNFHFSFKEQVFFRYVMSEIQVPEKFLKPFYKFHLSQINRAFKSDTKDWKVPVGGDSGDSVSCHMVWVQEGVLILFISHEKGNLKVCDINKVGWL